MSVPKTIVIDGEKFIRETDVCVPSKPGKRAIVVVDRGWIFAGDVSEDNGRIILTNAVHVFSWQGGFALLTESVKKSKADLRSLKTNPNIPEGCEIFRIPVADDWDKS